MDSLQKYRKKNARLGKVRSEFIILRDNVSRLDSFIEKYEEIHGEKISRSEVVDRLINVHLQPEFMSDFQPQDEALEFS